MKGRRTTMAKPTSDHNYDQVKVVFEVECTFSLLKNNPIIGIFNRLPEEDRKKVLRGTAVDSLRSLLSDANKGGSYAFLRSIK
jgi:hypothetical protein